LINKKEVELALVQSDTIDFAYNAKGSLQGEGDEHESHRHSLP